MTTSSAAASTPDDAWAAALAHHRAGRPAEAERLYRQVLAAHPDRAEAYSNLGAALQDLGRLDEAVKAYHQALALDSRQAATHANLGTALMDLGSLEDAAASLQRALTLQPESAAAWSNYGNALTRLGRLEAAMSAFQRALALQPDYAEAHHNLAFALLARGDFTRGWAEHEWRWQCAQFVEAAREFPMPRWDGTSLAGQTILLHAEQGFGDTIQFVRYAPLVAARGGRVVLECQPQLRRLLAGNEVQSRESRVERRAHRDFRGGADMGVADVVAQGEPLPACDLHAPLMSLPFIFGTTLDTVPAAVPYLRVRPALVEDWSHRLATIPGPRVGLVWAGNPHHRNDAFRSVPLAALAPLGATPGLSLVSLQKGPGAEQLRDAPLGLFLYNLGPQLTDFADTAAALLHLDLLITVDTAVAHLAGALGRAVWLLVPAVCDWRWLEERADSPWYPTMRLFRQHRRGDWAPVVARVAATLVEEVAR